MDAVETVRARIPDPAKDIRLNLAAVLAQGAPLTLGQRWGVAVAAAIAARNGELRDAVIEAARAAVGEVVIEDAKAAAALMAMNNVFYRFRHMIKKDAYASKPARLRMNRLAQPVTSKVDMELFALAVSAINGCEACVAAHEKAILEGGLLEDHVHESIRIAATMQAAAVALEMAEQGSAAFVAA